MSYKDFDGRDINEKYIILFVSAGVLEMTGCESTIRFSGHTLDKATKAKVILENYYSNLVTQHLERKQRYAMSIKFYNIQGGITRILLLINDYQ